MAKLTNRLTAHTIKTLPPGRHLDGGGLYLNVTDGGSRSWVFEYRFNGRRPQIGLGPFPTVTLAAAREKASAARVLILDGKDPRELKVIASGVTFGTFAETWLTSVESQWQNAKHRQQWRNTLATHCAAIWSRQIRHVDTDDVIKCLLPIWTKTPETAGRVRARIEAVLSAAKAKGLRTGENPARWRDHLDHLLPTRQTLTRGHHAAMPYDEVPAFVALLRQRQAMAAYALEWTILTAARSGETLGMDWAEIAGDVWTVPASRMKAKRPHRVPLSARCLEILEAVRPATGGAGIVFRSGLSESGQLSNMAMEMLLRRMQLNITVHGFRSSFRDWAGDCTSHPREIVEAALAHIVGDKAEQAYRRGDALERRRSLMRDWAGFLG